MLTVHFDSSFYNWLSRASDGVAEGVLSQLNQLGVRGVLSDIHRTELGRWAGPDEVNQRLHARLMGLRAGFLVIEPATSWDFLLQSQGLRAAVGRVEDVARSQMTRAHAWAHLARKPESEVAQEAIRIGHSAVNLGSMAEELSEALAAMGLPPIPAIATEFSTTLAEVVARGDLSAIGQMLDALMAIFGEHGFPPELTVGTRFLTETFRNGSAPTNPEEAEAFLAGCRQHFGRIWVEKENRDSLHNVVATTGETANVAQGRADEGAVDSLARSLQDGDHLAVFVNRSHEIDLIQVDKARLNQLKQMGERHPIIAWGLQERVFRASNLESVPKAVRETAKRAFGEFWMIPRVRQRQLGLRLEEDEVVRNLTFDMAEALPPAVPVVFIDLNPPEGEGPFVGMSYCPPPRVGDEIVRASAAFRVENVSWKLGEEATWILVDLSRLGDMSPERVNLMEAIEARLAPQRRSAKGNEETTEPR